MKITFVRRHAYREYAEYVKKRLPEDDFPRCTYNVFFCGQCIWKSIDFICNFLYIDLGEEEKNWAY